MKLTKLVITLTLFSFLVSCGGGNKKKEKNSKTVKKEVVKKEKQDTGLSNKGIGPIKELSLPREISQKMAKEGQEVFKLKCTACHRTNKRFIGPNPTNILKRRSPEWVMNMILNPEEMIQKDPIAKKLLIEYNGAPMANQNLTEKEARAILEFFRTLK